MEGSETPDVFSAAFDYGKFVATWALNYTNAMDNGWNIQFLGRDATLWLDNQGARLYSAKQKGVRFGRTDKLHLLQEVRSPLSDQEHVKNFIDCCRSRKEPNAPVEIGHRAVCGPHLANVSLKHEQRAHLSTDGLKVRI
jgi:hypothetical protein